MKRVIPHALTFSPGVHPTDRRLRMPLLEAVIFSFLWAAGLGQFRLEQSEISISKERQKSASISCKMFNGNFNGAYIFWYRQKPGQSIEYLMYIQSTSSPAKHTVGGKNKFEATKNSRTSTSTLKVNFLEQEDEAMYYCACGLNRSGWIKIFAEGTKLIVIPRDKRLEGDFSPKPTVFLPSVAEVNHDNSGTYLCLLEKFFPDAIKVEWKEKNGGTVLASQQGNTIKNGDTYMKFSWLTVTKKSMDREHRCIIKHEFNKGGVDQEIPFPPIDKGNADGDGKSEDANQEDGNGALQLQFANTAAHYTYVLLILKSSIYLAIVTFCLFKRAEVCGNGKSS